MAGQPRGEAECGARLIDLLPLMCGCCSERHTTIHKTTLSLLSSTQISNPNEKRPTMAPTPFSHDPTRVMHVVILSVFSFLALIAVIFRLWARKIQKKVWEANDHLIIFGLVGVAPDGNPEKVV